ncbi:MAG TPA: GGDEF domain-containing protein, partial [Gemmataceae bacterium]
MNETWVTPPPRSPRAPGPPSRPCLVQIYPTGAGVGSRQELGDKPLLIGRGADCDLHPQDASVSRHHARLEPVPGGYAVTDLKSTNGTFVNDEPVAAPRPLRDGDYLRIGNCVYRYLAGGNVEAEYHEAVYRMSVLDGLTQAHNYRFLLEFLEREILRATRHHRPLSLVLFDIDHFKAVNDRRGHLAGDFALRELASLVRQNIRREDLLARYGGEEFAVVLVETGLPAAVDTAERIRAAVEKHPFEVEGARFHLTISCGVADCSSEETRTISGLIKRADEKLYQAKRSGRNRV